MRKGNGKFQEDSLVFSPEARASVSSVQIKIRNNEAPVNIIYGTWITMVTGQTMEDK